MSTFTETLRKLPAMVIAAVMLTSAGLVADAAEKKKLKWSHTSRTTISESKSAPTPDYELVQGVYADSLKSTSPDFDLVDSRVFNQDENVSGNGRHRGLEIDIFRNGDTAWNRYEGTHKVVTKENGSWEVTYEGRFEFVGGTGRFKNIRGGGTYRGRITPEGLHEDDEAEVTW